MKRRITLVLFTLVLSLSIFAQPGTSTKPNTDSIAKVQADADKFVKELLDSTTLVTVQRWAYDNVNVKSYESFMQIYNLYLQNKYALYLDKEKQKK